MAKNKKKTKQESQRIHAKRRFLERYGLDFNRHVRREFERLIRCYQTHLIIQQSNRVSIHDVIYNGDVYRVVYDRNRHTIVTALPQDQENYNPEQEFSKV